VQAYGDIAIAISLASLWNPSESRLSDLICRASDIKSRISLPVAAQVDAEVHVAEYSEYAEIASSRLGEVSPKPQSGLLLGAMPMMLLYGVSSAAHRQVGATYSASLAHGLHNWIQYLFMTAQEDGVPNDEIRNYGGSAATMVVLASRVEDDHNKDRELLERTCSLYLRSSGLTLLSGLTLPEMRSTLRESLHRGLM
jgi:hypothetical protein